MKAFKNRKIDYSKPVQVYRNLTKKCWSLRQDRLVRAHSDRVLLQQCKFVIIKKYQERVRKTGHKNVHAFVQGMLLDNLEFKPTHVVQYNPYRQDYFEKSALSENSQPENIFECEL